MGPVREASIPASYTRLVAQELGMQARDLSALLVDTSLTPYLLWDENTRLTADQQIQVLENALELCGDPGFGLRLGRRLTPATHGPMGYLASSSPDLLSAVEAMRAFLPTRMSFVRLAVRREGADVVMECTFEVDLSPAVERCMAEVCAMTFFAVAEFIIGRPAHEATTYFTHADAGLAIGDFLPGRVHYGGERVAVRVPEHVCRIPNASANRESAEIARAQCEALLADLHGTTHTYQREIETMMLTHPAGRLTEKEAAAALFISTRTLARRLRQEGTSFRQVRHQVLARQAESYLGDSRLSVQAIARLLGYHDSANFRRAFKAWVGMTPEQYRATRTHADVNRAQP